jgi:hypothetical protein
MSDMLAKVLGEELDRMKARFYGLPPEVGSDVDALAAALRAALSRPAPAPEDPPECEREKWCDMPGGHSGECRSAMDALSAEEPQ